jgi:hypothetical protein
MTKAPAPTTACAPILRLRTTRAPRWKQRTSEAISAHRGPFLVELEYSRAVGDARAREFGLRATPECEPNRRDPLRLRLCALERPPGKALGPP